MFRPQPILYFELIVVPLWAFCFVLFQAETLVVLVAPFFPAVLAHTWLLFSTLLTATQLILCRAVAGVGVETAFCHHCQ